MDGDIDTVRLSLYFYTRYIFELAFQCHMIEVHLKVRSIVMLVLMKSGLSDSREEGVEDIKKCRSTLVPWCRSTLMPVDGPSIFQDLLRPRSHYKLQSCSKPTLYLVL